MSEAPPRRTTGSTRMLVGIVLLLVAVLVVQAVIEAEDTSVVLSSYSTKEGGARGLYETASRLGWPVARRTRPLRGQLDTGVVWIALAPAIPPTSGEVHALLEAVRGGAGLLVALTPGESPLADSLGISARRASTPLAIVGEHVDWDEDVDEEPEAVASPGETFEPGEMPLDSADPRAALEDRTPSSATLDTVLAVAATAAARDDSGYIRYAPAYSGEVYAHLRTTSPWPEDTVVFLAAERLSGAMNLPLPVAVGVALGRGRVVAVAEPRIFMNDILRDDAGVLPVRMLEWLSPSGERTLVFDEFHHGYGPHPSLGRAVGRFLGETTVGRTTVQLLLAAALLVLALGARPIAPVAPERIERRSPLEHVGALARAYEEVGASRLAARRLARGIRRRRSALGRAGSDADFLRDIAQRHPAVAGDVKLVIDAMNAPYPPERFARLAPALARIERTIAT